MNKPAKKPAKPPAPSVNTPDEWARINNDWAREKLEKMQAHADRFFTTDEDLPLSQHLILVFVTLSFVTFFAWASFAKLDEVTKGMGKVIPSSEVQKLQSLEGGIIDAFLVKEGDEVKTGQVLVRLRDVQASSDLGANQKRSLGLQAKIARLQAEAEGADTPKFSDEIMKGVPESVTEELNAFRANQQNNKTQMSVLLEQVTQRRQEISELQTRIADLKEVTRLSRQQLEMIRPLVARGSAPKLELIQKEQEVKERQTELNSLESSLPRVTSAVQEAEARIKELESAFQAQAQTELSATQIELNALKETLGALEDRKDRTEIRSTVNGYVKDIIISTVGGVVQPGMDIIQIVPKDDQLLIEANIRPADIAFLHPGQEAVVKITAYDYSIYGGLKGEVVDISADSIQDEKGESFYRVRVRTHESVLHRKDKILPIKPGMVASVDIVTGRKTIMQYIMKPIWKTMSDSLGER